MLNNVSHLLCETNGILQTESIATTVQEGMQLDCLTSAFQQAGVSSRLLCEAACGPSRSVLFINTVFVCLFLMLKHPLGFS